MLASGVPIYIVRGGDGNHAYSTHSNTYAWVWTLAYTRGVVPSALILIVWAVVIGVCFYRIILTPLLTQQKAADSEFIIQSSSPNSVCDGLIIGSTSDERKSNTGVAGLKTHSWLVTAFLVNAAVAITVNVLYINSTQQPLPALLHFGIQLSLAVFRLVYSYCVFPLLSEIITDPISNIGFRLRLLIVNNLVVPCIATAFASPSCFQVRCNAHFFTSLV